MSGVAGTLLEDAGIRARGTGSVAAAMSDTRGLLLLRVCGLPLLFLVVEEMEEEEEVVETLCADPFEERDSFLAVGVTLSLLGSEFCCVRSPGLLFPGNILGLLVASGDEVCEGIRNTLMFPDCGDID